MRRDLDGNTFSALGSSTQIPSVSGGVREPLQPGEVTSFYCIITMSYNFHMCVCCLALTSRFPHLPWSSSSHWHWPHLPNLSETYSPHAAPLQDRSQLPSLSPQQILGLHPSVSLNPSTSHLSLIAATLVHHTCLSCPEAWITTEVTGLPHGVQVTRHISQAILKTNPPSPPRPHHSTIPSLREPPCLCP